MHKVIFLNNVEVPYRVDFYNELGKYVDLTVLYYQTAAEQTHRNAEWFDKKGTNYKTTYLYNDEKKRRNPFDIIKILKEYKDACIIVCGYSDPSLVVAISWLKIMRVPYLLSIDGGIIKGKRSWRTYLKRLIVPGAKGYLTTGIEAENFLKYFGAKGPFHWYPFTSLFQKDILTNSVESKEKRELRLKLEMKEEIIVTSVGQFIYRKGYDVLLNAAKNIDKRVGIFIIGSKPTPEYLEYKNRNNLENVHFIGFKNKSDLHEYYKASDLFVLPTREDIWGLVINEAMACGLPVITTDKCVAGLELVDGKNGSIIPANNSDALAEAINSYIQKGESERICMSKISLQRISAYSIEGMSSAHKAIIEQFFKENGNGY